MKSASRNFRIIILFLILILLLGCSKTDQEPQETAVSAQQSTTTPTSTNTPSPTYTKTPVPPTFTPTFTATPSPTIALPVGIGEDIPAIPLQPITAENAGSIIEIAGYGLPVAEEDTTDDEADSMLGSNSQDIKEQPPKVYPWGRWDRVFFVYNRSEPILFGYDILFEYQPVYKETYLGEIQCAKGQCKNNPYPETVKRSYLAEDGSNYTLRLKDGLLDLYRGEEKITSVANKDYVSIEAVTDQKVLIKLGGGLYSKLVLIDSTTGETIWTYNEPNDVPVLSENWLAFLQLNVSGHSVYIDKTRVMVYDAVSRSIIYNQKEGGAYFVFQNEEKREIITIGYTGKIKHHYLDDPEREETHTFEITDFDRADSGTLITAAAISSDQSLIAIGLGRGRIVLYDTDSQEFIATWQGHTSTITAIDFSPDNTSIVSFGIDDYVRVWGVRGE